MAALLYASAVRRRCAEIGTLAFVKAHPAGPAPPPPP
ncbi:hypothetical protein PMI42_08211, partial [Bradyrhizobium sp. YR681]